MTEHERALSSSFLSVHRHAHTHRGSSNEPFTPSTCPCSCERFSSPLLSPSFVPHSFLFLLHLKFVDFNLLRTPHKEGMDLSDKVHLTTSHASSSHEVFVEPTSKRREDLGKHSVYTHFPKDRNCGSVRGPKITRAPCRRRNGGAVPRAENFGDLITADHKVLNDNCESRNNHRYAVVVQDLATQGIQAYPCKNKTSQETQRSLQKFLEPERKPKVIHTDNSLEFGKACEDLSWNHCTSTPHRSETNGIAERAVRRVKEGTSAVLMQSGLNESWWADSMECYTTLASCVSLACFSHSNGFKTGGYYLVRTMRGTVSRRRCL